jgi:hypothetical protein
MVVHRKISDEHEKAGCSIAAVELKVRFAESAALP